VHNLSKESFLQFKQHLEKGLKYLGIKAFDHQIDMMAVHARELMVWNKKINLTAIKDPLKIAEKHFLDSIASISLFENKKNLIDLGAGGGFPGIPIKIMNPLLKIVLIDASRKKINFLKHLIRLLHLDNIEAVHSRVEDLHGKEAYKKKFDVVISRAFTGLSGFAGLALPFLENEGRIYAMKGRNWNREITPELLKKFNLKTLHYRLPFEKSDRYVLKLSAKR